MRYLSDWVAEQEQTEGEKIAKEISKLSFSKGLQVTSRGEFEKDSNSKIIENPPLIVSIYVGPEKSIGYHDQAFTAKKVKILRSQLLIKTLRQTDEAISEFETEIAKETKRLEKIGGLLANMDREERRAKALLVEAKLKSMDGGQEMMNALTMDLPQV